MLQSGTIDHHLISQYRNILSKRNYKNVLSEEFFNISYLDKIVTNYINGKEVAKEKNDLENLIFFSIMGFYGQAVIIY